VLNGIHDLPRLDPQVALRDLRLSVHPTRVAPCAIKCYRLRRSLAAVPFEDGQPIRQCPHVDSRQPVQAHRDADVISCCPIPGGVRPREPP
jgi:hypothetical protein